MNAANEIAVYAFLKREMPFTAISQIIESVLGKHNGVASPSLDEVLAIDGWARDEARRLVKQA
jgi:1-deoxy-D-xylulose-5-phosphate reductoisomerase